MSDEFNFRFGLHKDEVKEIYIKQIEEITNTTFDRENLPGGVQVALAKLMTVDPEGLIVTSEKLNDMSRTYAAPKDIYNAIKTDLEPYTRPHLVGNKRKRRYIDGL